MMCTFAAGVSLLSASGGRGGEGDGGSERGSSDSIVWGDRQWEDNTTTSVSL